ncbi:prespore specific transcriptional activator RsfA [Gracilibacillus boraciitolerans JCM 21714]|uniref:Prespore specific transcriptional activator RsfA n=1 Tax=Gracilibacillus boraciitolerans JCM 21714 TaxID=1298598 RepID=W4VEB5_9BACI|nr:RsfA family transcriptional regulator [Gracilibacillus boraciitolerans]GAE91750.1 prespore specific transcriptional activator RsfA [Gracilibacillus boraciitolerans JCM 21714]
MQGNRQDAWTSDEDILLAETVIRYIREGRTQLEAFKEVGGKLSRTSAACGFRWNATLRKQYDEAIQFAKSNRKKFTLDSEHTIKYENEDQPNIHEVIQTLERLQHFYQQMDHHQELRSLFEENKKLKQQLQDYLSFVYTVNQALDKLKH